MNEQHKRAILIIQKFQGTTEERKQVQHAFALLFWNDPDFDGATAFHSACELAREKE